MDGHLIDGRLLEGRNLLITGVVTPDSIAWATAVAAAAHGANLVLSAPERDLDLARATAADLDAPVLALDVTSAEDWSAFVTFVRNQVGRLDGALHAVAWSPREGLAGPMAGPPPDRLGLSFATSVASYARLAGVLAELAPPHARGEAGASLVGLTFDASRAWGIYNWMGVMKTALETTNRFLARDLGRLGVRTNLVAAGPLHTRAASAIPGFDTLLGSWERAPLGWDATDAAPVADAICFLFSDLARAITGQVLHVDGGHSAVQGDDPAGDALGGDAPTTVRGA